LGGKGFFEGVLVAGPLSLNVQLQKHSPTTPILDIVDTLSFLQDTRIAGEVLVVPFAGSDGSG
jgi:hypothetical protein